MARIRKRTWTWNGAKRTKWLVDYQDQSGARRFKTFSTKKAAEQWAVTALREVQARHSHALER